MNPVPTSSLTDDITTVPSGPVAQTPSSQSCIGIRSVGWRALADDITTVPSGPVPSLDSLPPVLYWYSGQLVGSASGILVRAGQSGQ